MCPRLVWDIINNTLITSDSYIPIVLIIVSHLHIIASPPSPPPLPSLERLIEIPWSRLHICTAYISGKLWNLVPCEHELHFKRAKHELWSVLCPTTTNNSLIVPGMDKSNVTDCHGVYKVLTFKTETKNRNYWVLISDMQKVGNLGT